jgi:hypothetical protein
MVLSEFVRSIIARPVILLTFAIGISHAEIALGDRSVTTCTVTYAVEGNPEREIGSEFDDSLDTKLIREQPGYKTPRQRAEEYIEQYRESDWIDVRIETRVRHATGGTSPNQQIDISKAKTADGVPLFGGVLPSSNGQGDITASAAPPLPAAPTRPLVGANPLVLNPQRAKVKFSIEKAVADLLRQKANIRTNVNRLSRELRDANNARQVAASGGIPMPVFRCPNGEPFASCDHYGLKTSYIYLYHKWQDDNRNQSLQFQSIDRRISAIKSQATIYGNMNQLIDLQAKNVFDYAQRNSFAVNRITGEVVDVQPMLRKK